MSAGMRSRLEREYGLVMCYYEGNSWTRISGTNGMRLQQLQIDQNPDSTNFRVGLNRTSKLVQRAAVATQPTNIQVDVYPSDRDIGGVVEETAAQTAEDVINEYIDLVGFVQRWGDANFGRSVCGTYGFGLCLTPTRTRMVYEGQQFSAADCQFEAFTFMGHRLTLDPRVDERDLSRHDYVIYSDAWSQSKAERVYGDLLRARKINLNDQPLKTFGDLAAFELSVNSLTQNRLFSQYRSQSTTKAVLIHQVHRKSSAGYGRFDKLDLVMEIGGENGAGKMVRLTAPDQETPFGGCGLPMVMLHGHRRPDSMWSIGDVKMLKDDQDRLDRNQTYLERQLIQNTNYKWAIDRRSMSKDKTDEAIRKRITNAVGGIIPYDGGMGNERANPPHIISVPQPQSFLVQMQQIWETAMQQQTHSAPGNFGELKTHTPDASFQRALDEAGQVLDMRVAEDKRAMEQILTTLLGTVCKLVREQSPATLGMLVQRGFGPEELATLADMPSDLPPITIKVRDSSIRQRSYTARKQDLFDAASLPQPAIDGRTLRRELAQMDSSLTTDDAYYRQRFAKAARDVLLGMDWTPLPLGDRTGDLLDEFRKAIIDRKADPAAKQRLSTAIIQQQLMLAQEQAVLAPPPEQAAAPQDPAEGAFSSVMSQLQSQVSQQPQLAAA